MTHLDSHIPTAKWVVKNLKDLFKGNEINVKNKNGRKTLSVRSIFKYAKNIKKKERKEQQYY